MRGKRNEQVAVELLDHTLYLLLRETMTTSLKQRLSKFREAVTLTTTLGDRHIGVEVYHQLPDRALRTRGRPPKRYAVDHPQHLERVRCTNNYLAVQRSWHYGWCPVSEIVHRLDGHQLWMQTQHLINEAPTLLHWREELTLEQLGVIGIVRQRNRGT